MLDRDRLPGKSRMKQGKGKGEAEDFAESLLRINTDFKVLAASVASPKSMHSGRSNSHQQKLHPAGGFSPYQIAPSIRHLTLTK